MTLEEYKARREQLMNDARSLLSNDLAAAKAKKEEIERLDAQFDAEKEAKADLAALENKTVVPEIIQAPAKMGEENKDMEIIYNASSPEYKAAWLKNMAVDKKSNTYLFGRPTEQENTAYITTTANSGDIVPTEILNNITDLVESMAPIYADATKPGMEKGFSVPRRSAIAAGDAAVTNEGVANDDEENTFTALDLTGVEIKKHVDISRKMQFQSIDAFQAWVEREIAERIANAKEVRILSQLSDTTYGIASANVLTAQTYADSTIRTIMSMIHALGAKVVYANSTTIWTGLFGIVDGNNRPLFVQETTDDPLVQGRIYGARVKTDENIADNVAYFGVPTEVLANDFDPLTMSNAMDPKTFVTTIGGYSLFDAGLRRPLAFVKVTFTTGE